MPTTNSAAATIRLNTMGSLVKARSVSASLAGSISTVSMKVTAEAKAIMVPTTAEVMAVRIIASGRSASLRRRVTKKPISRA